jgi:hypothetical protein
MSEIDDGGPAFPRPNVRGMSLRDWLAGQALPTCIERCRPEECRPGETFIEMVARRSYEVSEAMIEARKVKP